MSVPIRVLLVEDSENDAALVARALRDGGYDVAFERVDSSAAMVVAVGREKWDLVISDYSMPGFSGTEALKLLRATGSDVPFIFLSGTIGEDTAVAAMRDGAQDYIMKDNLKRLLPAIQRELHEAELRKERKQIEQQVQQLQKFEAIGRLAGGIAHDFNNALGVILGWAQLGYEELPEGNSTRKKLEMICQQVQNTAGLSKQLLAFARRQILQPSNLGIGDLLTQSRKLLQSVIGDEIDFTVILSPDLDTIRADRSQIEQVLMNLYLNARDAMPQGGRLTVKAKNTEISEEFCRIHSYGAPGRYVLVEISDTGIGMDAATLDHIFEPFFTTKEIGRGTGLGLATVYGIVKQHGGFVNVYSELGHGTTFRIYLPSVSGAPDRSSEALPQHAQRGTETILVADDHATLRDLAREALTSQGYRVIVAHDGQEAVDCFKANSKQIRLVVLDMAMPRLNGREAFAQMRAVVPDLPVIFTTGHSAEAASLESNMLEGATFLQKPYDLKLLYRTVRSTLDFRGVQRPHRPH